MLPSRVGFWKEIVSGYTPETALEVGCNWGRNLEDLEALGVSCVGVDVNADAIKMANEKGFNVWYGDSTQLDFSPNSYELVFCSGLFIHLNTPELLLTMREMARVASRYVLFSEYCTKEEQEVPYRGFRGALFKRDFHRIFEITTGTSERGRGELGKDTGFDDTTWGIYDTRDYPSTAAEYKAAEQGFGGREREAADIARSGEGYRIWSGG